MRVRQRSSGLWPGLILMSLGGGLLAREFGYLPAHVRFTDFWPLAVVFGGVSGLLRTRGYMGAFFALAFIALGGVLLAGNLGFIAFPAARLWPVLLMLLGLSVLLRAGRGPGWGKRPDPTDPGAGSRREDWVHHSRHHGAMTTASDRLDKQITFSGAQFRVESQEWKGGELGVTAGGVEIDLRYARLAPEGALLDLRVVMGGVDIRVPDTWQVLCEVTPLFGGSDDVTRPTQGAPDAPRLRIVGTVTLGGVTVRN